MAKGLEISQDTLDRLLAQREEYLVALEDEKKILFSKIADPPKIGRDGAFERSRLRALEISKKLVVVNRNIGSVTQQIKRIGKL